MTWLAIHPWTLAALAVVGLLAGTITYVGRR